MRVPLKCNDSSGISFNMAVVNTWNRSRDEVQFLRVFVSL